MRPHLRELEVQKDRVREGRERKRGEGVKRERERQPKDSYANWAEMRGGALIYTRAARDWRE